MAYSYKAPQREQMFLLPPSIADWLPEDHLVWFVLDVVAMVDLAEFHQRHPNDGVGRRAYAPDMMLALLFYAYCIGLRSSRRIEAAVRSDVAFKAICADLVPDHIAVARFRADHEQAIKGAFTDILVLCAKAGLASLGTVAIDGTKIGGDAALDANRSEPAIRAEVERIMAEARRADEAEPVQARLTGGLPEVFAHRSSRLGRLQAALAEIEAEREAQANKDQAQADRWDNDAKNGRRPRGRRPGDPARALKKAQADLAAATTQKQQANATLAKLQAGEAVLRAQRSLAQTERPRAKRLRSQRPRPTPLTPRAAS